MPVGMVGQNQSTPAPSLGIGGHRPANPEGQSGTGGGTTAAAPGSGAAAQILQALGQGSGSMSSLAHSIAAARLRQSGGASGSAPQPSGPTPSDPAGPVVNTATSDPRLGQLWDMWQTRNNTSNTQRAIDRSNAAIADSAALLGKDAKALMASRGVGSDTGVGAAYVNRNITQPAQRAAAGAAADIAQGEQSRLDALLPLGLQIARAPGDQALASQGLALQQYQTSANTALAQQQFQLQAEQQRMAQQMAIAQLLAGL